VSVTGNGRRTRAEYPRTIHGPLTKFLDNPMDRGRSHQARDGGGFAEISRTTPCTGRLCRNLGDDPMYWGGGHQARGGGLAEIRGRPHVPEPQSPGAEPRSTCGFVENPRTTSCTGAAVTKRGAAAFPKFPGRPHVPGITVTPYPFRIRTNVLGITMTPYPLLISQGSFRTSTADGVSTRCTWLGLRQ
jgi:hypothetical protein